MRAEEYRKLMQEPTPTVILIDILEKLEKIEQYVKTLKLGD